MPRARTFAALVMKSAMPLDTVFAIALGQVRWHAVRAARVGGQATRYRNVWGTQNETGYSGSLILRSGIPG